MAIEGPLRELNLHDVFHLLDLSRKTGVMRIFSHLRNNEGMVAFDGGSIVFAEIRSNPLRIGEQLVRAGRITTPDLERARAIQERERGARRLGQVLVATGALAERELVHQLEQQVTDVVFELLSWQEGFFSFAEGPLVGVPPDAMVRIRTEHVLMEGARRIDEWSRIEQLVPHLGVIPELAPVEAELELARLDLLPEEWDVLAMVDGRHDVRGIADGLDRSEFDVARMIFGLVSTGVVTLRDPGQPRRTSSASALEDPENLLAAAEAHLAAGNHAAAADSARTAAALSPGDSRAQVFLVRAYLALGRPDMAVEEGRRAARTDPDSTEAMRWLGLALAAVGRFREAAEQLAAWQRSADAGQNGVRDEVLAALAAVTTLEQLIGGRGD